jgi:hypothetical protein
MCLQQAVSVLSIPKAAQKFERGLWVLRMAQTSRAETRLRAHAERRRDDGHAIQRGPCAIFELIIMPSALQVEC